MCGFVFSSDLSIKKAKYDFALASLFHRGPDDVQSVYLQDAFLGFSRLSIMDLSSDGKQPFSFDDVHALSLIHI